MKFDHTVPSITIQEGQPFPWCDECGFPVGRDFRSDVEWSHLDDDERQPWRPYEMEELTK